MKKLSELLKKREALDEERRQREALDAQIAALQAEEAAAATAKAEAARLAAIAQAQGEQAQAEQAVAGLVRDLAKALAVQQEAVAKVGALGGPVDHPISSHLRRAVAHQLRQWADLRPALAGLPEPERVDPRAAALADARVCVTDAERMLQWAKKDQLTDLAEHWREALKWRKAQVARLEGRPPEPEGPTQAERDMWEAMAEAQIAPDAMGNLLVGIALKREEQAQAEQAERAAP